MQKYILPLLISLPAYPQVVGIPYAGLSLGSNIQEINFNALILGEAKFGCIGNIELFHAKSYRSNGLLIGLGVANGPFEKLGLLLTSCVQLGLLHSTQDNRIKLAYGAKADLNYFFNPGSENMYILSAGIHSVFSRNTHDVSCNVGFSVSF